MPDQQAGSDVTRPTKSPAEAEGTDTPELPNRAPQPTTAKAHPDDQQTAWLRAGPEVFHAPGTQSRSKQIIGLSALTIVVTGLAVATVVHVVSPSSPDRRGNRPIAASQTAVTPLGQPSLSRVPASAAPATPADPVVTDAAPMIIPPVPMNPGTPVMTPAAPNPAAVTPRQPTRGTTEDRDPVVPAFHTTHPGNEDLRQAAISQNQPPPTSATSTPQQPPDEPPSQAPASNGTESPDQQPRHVHTHWDPQNNTTRTDP